MKLVTKRKRTAAAAEPVVHAEITSESMIVQSEDQDDFEAPKKRRKPAARKKMDKPQAREAGTDFVESPTLSGLCEDALVEILLHLLPVDLLHLSWTNKHLHNTLTTQSLAWVWKKARTENVPVDGMPECPSDLKEPQYANLMFSQHCFYCLRKSSDNVQVHLIWSCRQRVCGDCVKKKTLFAFENPKGRNEWKEEFPDGLSWDLLPSVDLPFGRNRYVRRRYYHLGTKELWISEHNKADDKPKWISEKRQQMSDRTSIIAQMKLQGWMSKWTRFMEKECEKMVLGHLKKLGWQTELDKITFSTDRPLLTEAVRKACSSRLSETELLISLEPFLNQFMGKVRDRRLLAERTTFLRERIPILKNVISKCRLALPANTPCPLLGDVFQFPLVFKIISDPELEFTETDLDPLVEAYPQIARQWKLEKDTELVDIIRSACGDSYLFDPDTVLNLATTMFYCNECELGGVHPPLGYPRILVHEQHLTKVPFGNPDIDPDIQAMHTIGGVARWNAKNLVDFSKEAKNIMAMVLDKFGFDSQVVTATEMHAVDPIFECVLCNSVSEGRFMMKWTYLAHHIANKHPSATGIEDYELELLQGPEAQTIRDRFSEEHAIELARPERSNQYYQCKGMICAHCREAGHTSMITDHLWEKHGIEDPTDTDMVPNLEVPPPQFRYSWPPRKVKRLPAKVEP